MLGALSSEQRGTVLAMTRTALIADFGDLEDISPELGNTIANVYLRRFVAPLLPQPPKLTPRVSVLYCHTIAKIQTDCAFAREAVSRLRKLAQKAHPSVVNVIAETCISILKYQIHDVLQKSYVRQRIERLLHMHQVDEFPGLLESFHLKQP
jgi:hypothetical protein